MIQVHSHAPLRTDITTVHSCATKCSPMIQVYSHTYTLITAVHFHAPSLFLIIAQGLSQIENNCTVTDFQDRI